MSESYKFAGKSESVSDPGDTAVLLTADGEPFDPPKFLRITAAGYLSMKGRGDDDFVDWGDVAAGETIWFRPVALHTDTLATVLGIY